MSFHARFVATALLTAVWGAAAQADAISNLINQATLPEYQSYLRVLSGVDPVPGTPVHLTNRYSHWSQAPLAARYLERTFESFGISAEQQIFDSSYSANVVAELPGTTRPHDIYLITSHYDTYSTPTQSIAPGCNDNASGTAAVLMAARIFSQYQFEGTVRFAAFSGEEQWMVGSEAYAWQARKAGERIAGVINLDMILHPGFDNMDPDPDYDLDLGYNADSRSLVQYMATQFATYTPLTVQLHNDTTMDASDHVSFWDYGYRAVGVAENTAEEIWGGSYDAYHTQYDTLDHPDLDWGFAMHTVRGSLAGLAGLAGLVPEPSTLVLILAAGVMRRRR